jgi:hypothetical protein
MPSNPFVIPFEQLPATLPIFPLPNAIVMPGCHLPLNIFEPRYLDMIFDALKENRLIGMVQPDTSDTNDVHIYGTGTAGRIVSFNEIPDGRLLVVLAGICRFDIVDEIIQSSRTYRQVVVDWSRFREDYEASGEEAGFDRSRLMAVLKTYFERKGFQTDWSTVEELPALLLVNALAGQLPLDAPEKQALVEAVTAEERISTFIHLLEFDVAGIDATETTRH